MSKTQIVIVMGVFSFLFGGCGKQSDVKTEYTISHPKLGSPTSVRLEKPPEITSESEEGFHDLVFYIQDVKKLSDGTQTIHALGNYKNQNVGLEINLDSIWKEGSLSKDVKLVTYRGIVTYHSVGSESDVLIQAIDELYGTKLSSKAMRSEIRFTGITLGGDPRDLAKEPVQIKLFYESGGDEGYAELYTNIELSKNKLQIREKDPEYRVPIIRALKAN
jgi:hypothetical protein